MTQITKMLVIAAPETTTLRYDGENATPCAANSERPADIKKI